MIAENINNYPKRAKILVVPLDWGLGHATRCIPIIQGFIDQDADVVLAASGNVVPLLQQEFPALKILPVCGYNVRYSRSRHLFLWKLATQIPGIFRAIKQERKWLQQVIVAEGIDAVISDNRPGLYNPAIHCTYITHQLSIRTGGKITDTLIRRLHYRYINRFHRCWIPDDKIKPLAGALAHPDQMPAIPADHIGILSRFKKKPQPKSVDFLLLVSGPEPQRSIFEKLLLKEFDPSPYSYVLLRGLPGSNPPLPVTNPRG